MSRTDHSRSLRIIVSGLAGRMPVGGMAWHYLQYVIGLARLGHDVYYHEDTWCWPFNPIENRETEDGAYSARFVDRFFELYAPDLRHRWHYLHLHSLSYGMTASQFREVAQTADVFINVSGASFIPDDLNPHCVKVFLDTDPGYNQIVLSERFEWSQFVDRWCRLVADHDRHFTFAESINSDECEVPKLGWKWGTTRMPILIGLWQHESHPPKHDAHWATVMTWNVFKGALEYQGVVYHDKSHEFEKLIDLPRLLDKPLKLAVGGSAAPIDRLQDRGWVVVDGPSTTLTPDRYKSFVHDSKGEVSAAKNVYVALKTGWFSERSACYLAAGRPVVLQDTGFSKHVPTGLGLLAFDGVEEAADEIREVESDYEKHRKAALDIAVECFSHDRVLPSFLEEISAPPETSSA